MDKMMYLAAQYLAAAGISFLEKKPDDSHTNMGFIPEDTSLNSRPLDKEGAYLSLNYKRFTLYWKSNAHLSTLRLDGVTHGQVLEWIREQPVNASPGKDYRFSFHYDLPYEIGDSFKFKLLDANRLEELTHLRILAQLVLEKFLSRNQLESEIRVWPHHFDTGIYAQADQVSKVFVGAGLAIPDDVVDEHYFYISGYMDNAPIPVKNLKDLSNGQWRNNGFTGAVFPAKEATVRVAADFFQEALEQLKLNAGI